ncbi:MAG: calcium-binding protein [Pseudomonadota bacterium]
MTTITVADGFAFSHSRLTISAAFTGDLVDPSSTSLRFAVDGTTQFALLGGNILYDAENHPTDGTIDSIQSYVDGTLAYSLTDAHLDLGDIFATDPSTRASAARIALFSGDDAAVGGSKNDYFNALGGHDVVMGGAGFDTIIGGDGNDHLYGQSPNGGLDGSDFISGDAGSDYIQGNAGNDELEGGLGSDRINGGADDDYVFGDEGNDTVNGNSGNDYIDGWIGNDVLRGGQGNDMMTGGSGNNIMMGDLGKDTIESLGDTDLLTGGEGADLFIRSASRGLAADSSLLTAITDFTHGEDRIDFRAAIGTRPEAVLSGTAASYEAAIQQAQTMMAARAGDNEIAAVQVGSDTYLFYTAMRMSDVPTVGILALDTTATDFDLEDFVRF